MTPDYRLKRAKGQPIATGTGLLAWDVVFAGAKATKPIGRWAGGTFGNVMVALSFLGWSSRPIARLKNDEEGRGIVADLDKWGIGTDLVIKADRGSTPIIVEYVNKGRDETSSHRFSLRCPTCGNRFPSYRPITLAAIQTLEAELPTARLFFFDRISPAALRLAQRYKDAGAVVFFEPSSVGDPRRFAEAVRLAHVVKFASDRVDKQDVVGLEGPLLLVETRGSAGLRYLSRLPQSRSRRWLSIKACKVQQTRDAAGAGDWCSAGLIHQLCRGGSRLFEKTSEGQLKLALSIGQALAAWTCGFEGARGGMYCTSSTTLVKFVNRLLLGQENNPNAHKFSDAPQDTASATDSNHSRSACCVL